MTFGNLLADVYRRCGFATSPSSDVVTRIKAFINETQAELFQEPGMDSAMNDTVTFASVASQSTYGLPQEAAKLLRLYEATNRIVLPPMSIGEWRQRYPDPSAVTGTPERWVDLGFDAVSVEPSDSSTLYILSSSASDTGTAYLEGFRSGGYPFTDSVAMTGATAVASTFTDIISVTKFYVSTTAVGTITLREDSGSGTTLATIPIGATYSRYRRIALVPTPASVITYTIDCERVVTDLVNTNDEPVLPAQFHYLLAIGARMKEYEKTHDNRWQIAQAEYQKGLKRLKFWLYSSSVGTPNLRGGLVNRATLTDGGTLATAGGSSSTPLAVTSGGTGFASYTIGDLLYADTSTTLAKLSDVATGKVLKSGGIGVAPAYGKVDLTADITGVLPAANAPKLDDCATPDDNTDLNVTSTAHGLTPKSPADATKFLDGSATPAWDTVKDSDLSTSDITTNDVTTSKHGFAPKGTADTAKFLRGDASYAVAFAQVCQGRLTLTTATPVTTADVTAATTMYFAPYGGNRIAVFDGTYWKLFTFTELSLALGTLTAALPYDVFVYDNSGTLTLEFTAWTSTTTRATALTTQDGVLVKSGATTRRYLGTFYTTATTTTEDSAAKRFVWNYYNRVPRVVEVLESTDNWDYTTATIRQARASTANQVAIVVGWAEGAMQIALSVSCSNSSLNTVAAGIGKDTITAFTRAQYMAIPQAVNQRGAMNIPLVDIPSVGYHYYAWNEYAEANGTQTWFGDGGAGLIDSGLQGVWPC